jgi:hypothetical protein
VTKDTKVATISKDPKSTKETAGGGR